MSTPELWFDWQESADEIQSQLTLNAADIQQDKARDILHDGIATCLLAAGDAVTTSGDTSYCDFGKSTIIDGISGYIRTKLTLGRLDVKKCQGSVALRFIPAYEEPGLMFSYSLYEHSVRRTHSPDQKKFDAELALARQEGGESAVAALRRECVQNRKLEISLGYNFLSIFPTEAEHLATEMRDMTPIKRPPNRSSG